jgi:hypothetical protein
MRSAIAEDIRAERGQRPRIPKPPADLTAEAQAWAAENAPIYRLLRRWAYDDMLKHGRWSIALVFEKARFLISDPKRKNKYLLNNSHRAGIARMICRDEPWLTGGIEMRRSRSDADLGRPLGERNKAGCAGEGEA